MDFEQIYKEHYRRVYSICLGMLKNEADAEDLTQDVFIAVNRKLDTFRGESALTTWLYRIAVNQVLMHWRKRIVVHEELTENGEMPDVAVQSNVLDKIAIEEALQQLPNGYRNVLLLHAVGEYGHDEIGQILGVTAGTGKSQFFKAKAKMRRLLMKKGNPRVYAPAMAA